MNPRHFVNVEGTLRLEGPRSDFELRAHGPGLRLEVERARGLLDLRNLRRSPAIRSLRRALGAGGLELSIALEGFTVVRLSAGGRARLQAVSLLRALARRLSAFLATPRIIPSKTKK